MRPDSVVAGWGTGGGGGGVATAAAGLLLGETWSLHGWMLGLVGPGTGANQPSQG